MMAKKKRIEKDKYRIIKLGKEALWEFIYESVIDGQEEFFDIPDSTEVVSHLDIDFEKGEFICIVSRDDEFGDGLRPLKKLNMPVLLENMENTTQSMHQANRYKEFTLDELEKLQQKIHPESKE